VDGERLTYDAPAGVMTAELLALLRQHKPALLALLAPRACPCCGTCATPELNLPELLCTHCAHVLGSVSPQGRWEANTDLLALPLAERAALYEYEGGLSRAAAEALARHGNVVGLPACPQCHGLTYQYADGFVRCTTPGCAHW
jgi:hypothetical protein